MKHARIATIYIRSHSASMAAAKQGFLRAAKTGSYQGEHFAYESPAALFREITPKRWELLARLQQTGPLAVRALARDLERDVRRVHDDVTTLLEVGLIEKTADGKVCVPFKEIRIDSVLKSTAA
jgi:predicted transcriptional regulator